MARVLTVNAGSTSLKLATVTDGDVETTPSTLEEAFDGPSPDAVAHRVVHGGDRTDAELVDDAVIEQLRALTSLAPLHQPPALAAMDSCRDRWPDVPNVACFDTAFHATIPLAARTYALPGRYRSTVRSYGFHGLSYAWASAQLRTRAPEARRVLLAHLGGGQSLCGTLDGRSVITTMGFTPLDGLVMGTRCGALDPGAVSWLHEQLGSAGEVGRVLDQESGLLGLCGSADMRVVHERVAAGDADAQLAFDVWRHRLVTFAGACITALGGVDAIVFTGGIGEHDPIARAALVDGLGWLGVEIDEGASDGDGDREITAPGSAARVFVIAAREDLQLAREATSVAGGQ